VVLKVTDGSLSLFAYGTITLYGSAFLNDSAKRQIDNSLKSLQRSLSGLTTPVTHRPADH
jgi:hypothetical protein